MQRIQQTLRTAITLSIIGLPSVASACPTCKDSLHDNGAATGYAISILFMMSMPLLITAFWAVLIWRLRSNMVPRQIAVAERVPSLSSDAIR